MTLWKEKIIERYQIPKSHLDDPLWDFYPVDFENIYSRLCQTDCVKSQANRKKWSFLSFVSFIGHADAIKHLIDKKELNPQAKDSAGLTPLHYAALSGNVDAIKYFIKGKNLNPEAKDYGGNTSLHYAALSGNVDAIKYFIEEKGLNPEAKDNGGKTSLHYAAENGHLDAIKYFIEEKGLNPEAKDNSGQTSLHYAAWSYNLDAIKYFIEEKGLNPEAKDSGGNTSLHYAAARGHVGTIKYLIEEKGLNPEAKDNGGKTSLHHAAENGSVGAIKYFIEEQGLNPKAMDNSGQTSLHYAAWSGHVDLMKYLIEKKGLNPEAKDSRGNASLHYAAVKGHADAIKYLIEEKGVNPKVKNNFRETPLHWAAMAGNVDAMKYLIEEKGLDPGEKDDRDQASLHYAALRGGIDAVQYLIIEHPAATAKSWTKNINGDTPDSLAIKSKMPIKPRELLNQALAQATTEITSEVPQAKTYKLLNAFINDWRSYLLNIEDADLDVTSLEKAVDSDQDCSREIKVAVESIRPLLNIKALGFQDKPLTLKSLNELLENAKKASPKKKWFSIHSSPSSIFIDSLGEFAQKVGCPEEKISTFEFFENQIRTINVIVGDYERKRQKKTNNGIDKMVAGKILSAQQIAALRPQPKKSNGLNITPENYAKHFEEMKNAFASLVVSDEVKRTVQEVIFPGIEHIINNEEAIVHHVTTRFGVLYYLVPDMLPLHTDHAEILDPKEYRKILHRILENLFGAIHIFKEAGKLAMFFEKMSHGYCLEGRIRDAFEWAACLSEITSFDEFMAEQIKAYLAYQSVMHPDLTDDEITRIDPALKFILTRFDGFPCRQDDNYAPGGEITKVGVKEYLSTVLCYSEKNGGPRIL